MHKLVQIVRFESARKLPKVPEGHPCGNVYGLAFKLEVHVEGKVDPETGFVIDFGHIESAIKPTYDLIDHNYLNDIKGLENPTSEFLLNGFGIICIDILTMNGISTKTKIKFAT